MRPWTGYCTEDGRTLDAARENGVPVIFSNDAHLKGIDHELKLWGITRLPVRRAQRSSRVKNSVKRIMLCRSAVTVVFSGQI